MLEEGEDTKATRGEGAPSYSTVKKWATELKHGREGWGCYVEMMAHMDTNKL